MSINCPLHGEGNVNHSKKVASSFFPSYKPHLVTNDRMPQYSHLPPPQKNNNKKQTTTLAPKNSDPRSLPQILLFNTVIPEMSHHNRPSLEKSETSHQPSRPFPVARHEHLKTLPRPSGKHLWPLTSQSGISKEPTIDTRQLKSAIYYLNS